MKKNKLKGTSNTQKLFNAKESFHKKLAKIPFEEKIETLVKLQKLANDIKSATGRKAGGRVWKI